MVAYNKNILFLCLILLTVNSIFIQGEGLPSVKIRDISGKTVDTSKLNNDGKPFIISFFATWCKPCLRELDAIHDVYDQWQKETGVKLIAVSLDEAHNANRVKPLVSRFGWKYEVLLDINSEFARSLNVNPNLIPAVIIIDGKGAVVESRTGYTDGAEQHLIETVKRLLSEK
jgi:peroxiredoxin